MAKLDIITHLQEKGLDHILEDIFGRFDLKSIEQSELVSLTWQEAINKERIWKPLYQNQIKRDPEWRRLEKAMKGITKSWNLPDNTCSIPYTHRKIFQHINKSSESLISNWKNFKHQTKMIDVKQTSPLELEFQNNTCFSFIRPMFTANYIIYMGIGFTDLLIFNRWTYESVKVLTVPVKENRIEYDPIAFSCSAVNENVLVSTLRENWNDLLPAIYIWDINTYGLLKTIAASELGRVKAIDLEIFVTEHDHIGDCCQHCKQSNDGNIVITIADREEINARWLPSCCGQAQVVLLYKETLSNTDGGLHDVVLVKRNYIFLIESDIEDDECGLIQIRNTSTSELVSTITESSRYIKLDYRGEFLVTATIMGNPIRIWNISTGECLKELPVDVYLERLKFISDKLLFGCTHRETGLLWDFQTAIESKTLDELEACQLWKKERIFSSQFKRQSTVGDVYVSHAYLDEFQLVAYLGHDCKSKANYLSALTFLTV